MSKYNLNETQDSKNKHQSSLALKWLTILDFLFTSIKTIKTNAVCAYFLEAESSFFRNF